jgi:hypothetical protein
MALLGLIRHMGLISLTSWRNAPMLVIAIDLLGYVNVTMALLEAPAKEVRILRFKVDLDLISLIHQQLVQMNVLVTESVPLCKTSLYIMAPITTVVYKEKEMDTALRIPTGTANPFKCVNAIRVSSVQIAR